jgi:hypothetical protein
LRLTFGTAAKAATRPVPVFPRLPMETIGDFTFKQPDTA